MRSAFVLTGFHAAADNSTAKTRTLSCAKATRTPSKTSLSDPAAVESWCRGVFHHRKKHAVLLHLFPSLEHEATWNKYDLCAPSRGSLVVSIKSDRCDTNLAAFTRRYIKQDSFNGCVAMIETLS